MITTHSNARLDLVADGFTPAAQKSVFNVTVLTADPGLRATIATLLNDGRYRLSERGNALALCGLLSYQRTDAVLIDLRLPVTPSADISALLNNTRRDPTIPVIGICRRDVTRAARIRAIETGVWDVIEVPVSADELIPKLDNWVSLKRSFDDVRSGILVDAETGHYSTSGTKRRLREMAALARRSGHSLSCVLFGIDSILDGVLISSVHLEKASREFAQALHERSRDSDVVGRVELLKFVVLAPLTPRAGAVKLAERFTSWSVTKRVQGAFPITFSAGISGFDGKDRTGALKPEGLLISASRALRAARVSGAAQVAVAWGGGGA